MAIVQLKFFLTQISRRGKKFLVYILFILPLVSCAENNDPVCLNSPQGEEISIKKSQTISYCKENISISFLEVVNDSRCPSDVTCVWAGFVEVKLDIQGINDGFIINLATGPNPNGIASQVEFEDISIKLVDVIPYPATNVKINPNEIRTILIVEKSGA